MYIYIYIYINYSRRYFFKISDISNLTNLLESVEDSKDSKYHLFKKNVSLNNLYIFEIYKKGTLS